MGCYGYGEIFADNDRDDNYHGCVENGYPGCALCPMCCYAADYNDEVIKNNYNEYLKWRSDNPNEYTCTWSCSRGYFGTFTFFAPSLERAREIAKESVYEWVSLVVKPFNRKINN